MSLAMNRTQLYYYKCIMIDTITIITCIVELVCLTQAEQSPINYNILVNPPTFGLSIQPCLYYYVHTHICTVHAFCFSRLQKKNGNVQYSFEFVCNFFKND